MSEAEHHYDAIPGNACLCHVLNGMHAIAGLGTEEVEAATLQALQLKGEAAAEKPMCRWEPAADCEGGVQLSHQFPVKHVSWHGRGDYFATVAPTGNTQVGLPIHLTWPQMRSQCIPAAGILTLLTACVPLSRNMYTIEMGAVKMGTSKPVLQHQRSFHVTRLMRLGSTHGVANCKTCRDRAVCKEVGLQPGDRGPAFPVKVGFRCSVAVLSHNVYVGAVQAVLVHQLSKRATQNPFRRARGRVAKVAFHPNKPFFFVATLNRVYVYNLAKQELAKSLRAGQSSNTSFAIHPSGDHIIVGKEVLLTLLLQFSKISCEHAVMQILPSANVTWHFQPSTAYLKYFRSLHHFTNRLLGGSLEVFFANNYHTVNLHEQC